MPKPAVAEQTVVKRLFRRQADEEGHGGAWKVAFADFCLALLCLFLVMWLLAVRQEQNLEQLLKSMESQLMDGGRGHIPEVIGHARGSMIDRAVAPGDAAGAGARGIPATTEATPAVRTRYESAGELAELAKLIMQMSQDAGLASNLQWVVTPYGLRIMIHDTDKEGMFEVGGTDPSTGFRALLQKMGPLFSRIENQMLIVGHTDARQYPEAGPGGMSNWLLSSERAMAARRYLLAGGMPEHSVLQVVGLADGSPLNADDPMAPENRRIELLILTKQQARQVNLMYGAPADPPARIMDGVDVSAPSPQQIKALSGQLTPPQDR